MSRVRSGNHPPGCSRKKTGDGLYLLVLVCILGFFIIPASASGESCTLSVASIPDKAMVVVNGSLIGTAPVSSLELPCGNNAVTVSSNGYVTYTENVLLENGKPVTIIANLQRLSDRGLVTIRSVPPEGNLFVDGKARGVTPLTVDNLLPGRHEILIMKTGYEDYHDVISVTKGTTTEYTEYMVPLPGTGFLSVTSSPEGADVRIDGIMKGTTPTNLQRISTGNHTVEIYQNGYWNFSGIVTIKGGEALLVKADLTIIPTSCTLYLDSSPHGLEIYLNDTFKGFAPVTLENLPPGDYVLEFRQQNGVSVNRSFRFFPGRTNEIFAILDDENGGSMINKEWLYQNDSHMAEQPGWVQVNATQVIEKTFTWDTNGHTATITLDIPHDLYNYYKAQAHPTVKNQSTLSAYTINEKDRQYLHALVNQLKDASEFKSYRARNDYRNVIAFVQSIEYKNDIDPGTKKVTEYWKYPIETLGDGGGDCEDTAILSASLLKEMGHDVAVVFLTGKPGHAAVAVACDNCNGYYYPLNGKRYYYLETTGTGFSLGVISDKKHQTSTALLIPL